MLVRVLSLESQQRYIYVRECNDIVHLTVLVASKSAKKLQPSQARDVSITTPCRHQFCFNSGASQPRC